MSETIVVPDNGNNNNGWNGPLGYLAMGGNNNGFLGGNGLGAGVVGFILGALINNNGNGLFGFGGGSNGAAAASLGAQATSNSNTEMVMNAINGTDADVRLLATTLNSDMDSVRLAINTVQGAVAQVGNTVGMTGLQVINAIQAGDAALASQLCQCCNAMQTTVMNGIAGVNQNIDATRAAQQLSDCRQTFELSDNNNRNTQSILAKLDAMSTQALQDKLDNARAENTRLSGEISQYQQNQYLTGVVAQSIAPINAQVCAIAKEVDDIKCKMPATTPVIYPQITAVNTTPYMGGWGNGFNGWGYGVPGGSYWG